jgi:hypothetical protein
LNVWRESVGEKNGRGGRFDVQLSSVGRFEGRLIPVTLDRRLGRAQDRTTSDTSDRGSGHTSISTAAALFGRAQKRVGLLGSAARNGATKAALVVVPHVVRCAFVISRAVAQAEVLHACVTVADASILTHEPLDI